jgi:8-oxo-dGTP pyrophosphatase MutT (NUDIX family)
VRAALGGQFVGMMLYGSLAGGDFDAASDIDVLVVTQSDPSDELFAALAALHARLAQGPSPWANQLEISYIPLAALRRHDPAHATHPRLDRGADERLHWAVHHDDWIIQRHALRQHGLVVAGPAPAELIDPVSPAELRAAMRPLLLMRQQSLRDHPADLNFRGYQSYVVLTVCRTLYTLAQGTVVSKPVAVRWALATLDARWHPLIERALSGRHEHSGLTADDVSGTLAFVQAALEQTDLDQGQVAANREGAVIIFENAAGQVAFQLRDDRPEVPFANHWGLFGGWREQGETPEQTVRRECQEELDLALDPSRLVYLFDYGEGDVLAHVFHYPVTDELRAAHLSEGQRLEFLCLSDLKQRVVVPRHRAIVARYTGSA